MSNDQSIPLMALVFYIKISQVKQDCITFDVKKKVSCHTLWKLKFKKLLSKGCKIFSSFVENWV